MINKILKSLDQRPNITNSIVKSLVYAITLITIFFLSTLLVNAFIIKIKRTIYMKYFSENYIWIGIILFVIILSWKIFELFRNRHKEISKTSTTNKCLTLVCYFTSFNIASIAATTFIIVYYNIYISLIALIFYIPSLIILICSAYILMGCLKEIIKSSKAFDVFAAVITSFLDALLLAVIIFLLGLKFSFIEKYISKNIPWYMIACFIVRLTQKIEGIYKNKAES